MYIKADSGEDSERSVQSIEKASIILVYHYEQNGAENMNSVLCEVSDGYEKYVLRH